ncbi:MAG: hypothetical protein RR614_02205 [Eubacterium sp.]
MKKNVIIGIVIGAVLLTGSTALAANGGRFGENYTAKTQTAVCDNNGDSLCDITGDALGTGNCDQSGNCQKPPAQNTTTDTATKPSAQNRGNHTVCDTNGDGLCDRSGTPTGTGNCNGTGSGCGYGPNTQGGHRGNGNGACDGTQRGNGSGHHRQNNQ